MPPVSSGHMRATSSPFLRLLVIGPPKVGKTGTCVATAPGPVYLINSDDEEAWRPADDLLAAKGQEFTYDNAFGTDLQAMQKVLREAHEGAKAGRYKTIVWDTITLFAKRLLDLCEEASRTKQGEVDGRKAWPAYHENLRRIIDKLFSIPAHVIVTAHLLDRPPTEGKPGGGGLLPALAGQSADAVPARFQDVVLLGWDKNERTFFTSVKGVYGLASRSLPGVEKVPADITKLIAAIVARRAGGGPAA